MSIPTWTQTIDNLFTSTWAKRKPTAIKQAFLKTPLAYWLRQRDRVENQSGYRRLEIPLDYGDNDSVRWLARGGTMPLTDPELLTTAYDDWKYVAVNVSRFGQDDQKNRGKAAAIKLVETKLNSAERALYEEFERAFFADGSGSNEPNGLQNLVSATPTTGTVHGINRATYSWWRNQVKASSGASSAYLLSDMRNLLNTCQKYAQSEYREYTLITTQTVYELYDDEVIEQKIIDDHGGSGSMGDPMFDIIKFKGRPLMWSPSAPSGLMYFINTSFLKLIVDEAYWMDMTEWKAIPDQVGDRVAQILCALNLMTSRPVVHGVLTGIA